MAERTTVSGSQDDSPKYEGERHAEPAGGSGTEAAHLKRSLRVPSLTLFGLAYMIPLTVFTTYGIVTAQTEGHLPSAYIVTLAAMLFTAYGYANMVRAYPRAGSAYTYTRHSFGSHLGFMAGWSLMLDYILLPMVNYMVIGIYMTAQFPSTPAWLWVLIALVTVTGLNILGINLVARMNLVLIAFQLVFVALFIVLALRQVFAEGSQPGLLEPFFSPDMSLGNLVAGSAILCFSFLGFDAVSTLSEEAKDPQRSIPRAILMCTLFGGVLFIIISYVGHLVMPDWQAFSDLDSASLDVIAKAGGTLLTAFFTAAYISGCFASAMTSQASVSRILFAMGRDRVLPNKVFGRLHPRFMTPHLATIVVGVISLSALALSLDFVSSIISFGALIAFTVVNLAVIKHYIIDRKSRGSSAVIRYGVVPAIGALLCLWLWTSMSGLTFLVGLIWVGLGVIYLAGLTRGFARRPPELDFAE